MKSYYCVCIEVDFVLNFVNSEFSACVEFPGDTPLWGFLKCWEGGIGFRQIQIDAIKQTKLNHVEWVQPSTPYVRKTVLCNTPQNEERFLDWANFLGLSVERFHQYARVVSRMETNKVFKRVIGC